VVNPRPARPDWGPLQQLPEFPRPLPAAGFPRSPFKTAPPSDRFLMSFPPVMPHSEGADWPLVTFVAAAACLGLPTQYRHRLGEIPFTHAGTSSWSRGTDVSAKCRQQPMVFASARHESRKRSPPTAPCWSWGRGRKRPVPPRPDPVTVPQPRCPWRRPALVSPPRSPPWPCLGFCLGESVLSTWRCPSAKTLGGRPRHPPVWWVFNAAFAAQANSRPPRPPFPPTRAALGHLPPPNWQMGFWVVVPSLS